MEQREKTILSAST